MNRLHRTRGGTWALALAFSAVSWAGPQPGATPVDGAAKPDVKDETPILTGTPTVDLVPLDGTQMGSPLQHGNVVKGSERVTLDGRLLTPVEEYAMDYEAGVVYLRLAGKPGSTLTVSYRYAGGPAKASGGVGGAGKFKFSLTADGSNAVIGSLGMTERTADGRVLRTNAFGFKNGFNFGGGKLSGLYIYGQRSRARAESAFSLAAANEKAGDAATEEGASQLILQNYASKFLGGSITADYQDIGQNFAAFGQVREAGYSDGDVERLGKERGLTRFGFGINNAKLGALGLSHNYRSVKDGAGSIDWRSYGLEAGGLKLGFTSRRVDANFNRFKDISEADREQLMREKGMSRETLTGEWGGKGFRLGYTSDTVADDGAAKKIIRREFALDTAKVKFLMGDQEVDEGFGRFNDLMGHERERYGREAGLKRNWMSVDTAFSKSTTLSWSQSELRGEKGGFRAENMGLRGNGWSITQTSRRVDDGFNRINAMAPSEMDDHIKAIATMYGTNARPEDRGAFSQTPTLNRTSTAFAAGDKKGKFALSYDRLKLDGTEDGATVDRLRLKTGSLDVSYRRQNLGEKFGELSRLMEFEKNSLGTVAGLDRSDLNGSLNLRRNSRLAFASMQAVVGDAGAKRTSLAYEDKKIQVAFNARSVDANFDAASQLVDPERELLGQLRGFEQKDIKARWQLSSSFSGEFFRFDAKHMESGEERALQTLALNWAPSSRTQMGYRRDENHVSDLEGDIFLRRYEAWNLAHNFGKYGRLTFGQETLENGGRANKDPDMKRQRLAYDVQVNKKTSLATEQIRTKFGDGNKEDVSSYTVATELSKRTGVSVTDTKIDREGEDRDETRRNYGVWYDLGKGLRVSWGYARHLNGEGPSTMNSTFALGTNNAPNMQAQAVQGIQQGRVGAINIGGGYGVNSWDTDARTQSFANVGFSTARPLSFGPVKNLTFAFNYDAAADRSAWAKENRFGSIGGKLWGVSLGFDYRGQMDALGNRGIDRTYRFQTDPDERRALRGNFFYKVRTLPNGENIMIRDINLTLRPAKSFEVTHQLLTNPEIARGDVFLGSVPQASRLNRWKADIKGGTVTIGGQWEQLQNEQDGRFSVMGGVNLTLFPKSPSPVRIFYGVEEANGINGFQRQTAHRYSLEFMQRPGKNQVFSLFVGNLNYQHSIAQDFSRNNWTVRANYQLRF